jgi:hypothetical protein
MDTEPEHDSTINSRPALHPGQRQPSQLSFVDSVADHQVDAQPIKVYQRSALLESQLNIQKLN